MIIALIALMIFIGAAIISYEVYKVWKILPSEQQIKQVYTASQENSSGYIKFDDIPSHVKNAILAAENSNYLEDGSSLVDCVEVLILRLFSLDEYECDSAIVIFSVNPSHPPFNTSNRMPRPVEQFLYSWKLENSLGTQGVFELLINEAYFGQKAFGISNAAEQYFNKTIKDLTIAEAALLAGILQAPSRYNPTRNPEDSKKRRDLVLSKMKARGMISDSEIKSALASELTN